MLNLIKEIKTAQDNDLIIKCYNVGDSIINYAQIDVAIAYLRLACKRVRTTSGESFIMRAMAGLYTLKNGGLNEKDILVHRNRYRTEPSPSDAAVSILSGSDGSQRAENKAKIDDIGERDSTVRRDMPVPSKPATPCGSSIFLEGGKYNAK